MTITGEMQAVNFQRKCSTSPNYKAVAFCDGHGRAGFVQLVWIAAFLSATGGLCHAQVRERPERSTSQEFIEHNLLESPSVRQATSQLANEAVLLWEKKPLREAINELAETFGIRVWLDRRLDPGQLVTLVNGSGDSLQQAFTKLADRIGGSTGLVEGVLYIGPKGEAAKVQARSVYLHHALCQQNNDASFRFKLLSWPDISTPNEVLNLIRTDWNIDGMDTLPHDLWYAGNFGTCTLATQLTLLAAGFDLTPHVENGNVRFESTNPPIQWLGIYAPEAISSEYRTSPSRKELTRKFGGRIIARNGTVQVRGSTELHLALLAPAGKKKSSAPEDFEKRLYSLEVRNELATVLSSLAESLGLQLQWSPEVPVAKRRTRIEFNVKDANIDGLLQACAKAGEVRILREGTNVTVTTTP
jgi:hypothetical protein